MFNVWMNFQIFFDDFIKCIGGKKTIVKGELREVNLADKTIQIRSIINERVEDLQIKIDDVDVLLDARVKPGYHVNAGVTFMEGMFRLQSLEYSKAGNA